MKTITTLFIAALLLTCACKREATDSSSAATSTATPPSSTADVDAQKVSNSFASADASLRDQLEQAIAAVKNADYQGALSRLQGLAANAKLTPEQKQSLKDFMTQVETKVSAGVRDASKAVTENAKKAAGQFQNVLTNK